MSGDYSRKTFDAGNNFSGVLMQQGRVQLDADWNEQVAIGQRRIRAETVDLIGRARVPHQTQNGFKIELKDSRLWIHPGRMYVDGLLAENHGAETDKFNDVLDEPGGTGAISYDQQPHFPNADEIDPLPTAGRHIVYLDVWQREVTHVKHPGLVEPAVGVDTTARLQTVWQVKVLKPAGADDLQCPDAVEAWDARNAPSAGRLSTGTVEIPDEENPCLLPPSGGYRGLENRLYRVEIHDAGKIGKATFKWARHNASVESRVIAVDGSALTVTQSKWDAMRRFKVNDWVEVTDDVRELAGNQGEMRRIDEINYDKNTITLSGSLPAEDFPASTLVVRHTRIRLWDQQQGVDSTTGLVDVTTAAFHLEHGIEIKFSLDPNQPDGEFKTGDYWVFYARSTDASVEILEQVPPRGIHHHYARLAVVAFPNEFIEDCRDHWPPASGATCCTVTVGDGRHSRGEFASIQAAIDNLPDTGGKVCLLPGEYHENVNIFGRQGITLTGCGTRSRIMSQGPSEEFGDADPVIHIENSVAIQVESLAIEAHRTGIGILVDEAAGLPDEPLPGAVNRSAREPVRIRLHDLHVQAALGSGIECRAGRDLAVQRCHVHMLDVPGDWPGIFLIGDDALLEDNVISVHPIDTAGANDAGDIMAGRGGIQIGATSERVRVIDNLIQYGLGDGITLGSLEEVDENDKVIRRVVAWPIGPIDPCDPCSPPSPRIPPRTTGEEEQEPPSYRSAGALYDIVIEANRIYDMGRNGIGVAGFFDLNDVDEFISVEGLEVRGNDIRRCLKSPLAEIDDAMVDHMGYGGVALADVSDLIVHHNTIQDNGPDHREPVCGIFILHGEGVDISGNRILNNGAKTAIPVRDARRGNRGGIHIFYAVAPTVDVGWTKRTTAAVKSGLPRQNGVPAAKIHDNIVSQPLGRALTLTALGPVSVANNQFTSLGVLPFQPPVSTTNMSATVFILNLGLSNEFYGQLLGFRSLIATRAPGGKVGIAAVSEDSVTFVRPGLDDLRVGRYLANGNVLFAGNQCALDLFDREVGAALSSVTIMSLDDVGFHDNECDCNLLRDFVWVPNFLLALSLRASDNRLKEGVMNAFVSAVTSGWMNATTGNQATHCLIVVAPPALKVDSGNKILANLVFPKLREKPFCDTIKTLMRRTTGLGDWI